MVSAAQQAQEENGNVQPIFYTPKEVIVLLGVSPQTLWRLRKKHGFPAPLHICSKRATRYPKDLVDKWIQDRIDDAQKGSPQAA